MIDRNDLDLRINAHQSQTENVSQVLSRAPKSARTSVTIRQQIAAVLVSVAVKLDGHSISTSSQNQANHPKPASS